MSPYAQMALNKMSFQSKPSHVPHSNKTSSGSGLSKMEDKVASKLVSARASKWTRHTYLNPLIISKYLFIYNFN